MTQQKINEGYEPASFEQSAYPEIEWSEKLGATEKELELARKIPWYQLRPLTKCAKGTSIGMTILATVTY